MMLEKILSSIDFRLYYFNKASTRLCMVVKYKKEKNRHVFEGSYSEAQSQ